MGSKIMRLKSLFACPCHLGRDLGDFISARGPVLRDYLAYNMTYPERE